MWLKNSRLIAVIGVIQDGYESTCSEGVEELALWWGQDNLELNMRKSWQWKGKHPNNVPDHDPQTT